MNKLQILETHVNFLKEIEKEITDAKKNIFELNQKYINKEITTDVYYQKSSFLFFDFLKNWDCF